MSAATDLLDTAIAQVQVELAALNAVKPDYSLDGESYQWNARFTSLTNELKTLEQARQFTAATEVTALAITKLDGTAKGGVVLAIANQFKIPVKFIGMGEKIEDLLIFDKHEFVDSLFSLQK